MLVSEVSSQKPLKAINCINLTMQSETITISKKEYEGMKETIELLQDPEMMKQILESEKNIKAKKIKKFEY